MMHYPGTEHVGFSLTWQGCGLIYIYIIKIKIHSSCEIEFFVETHLYKLCVILRSRVSRVVCPLYISYICLSVDGAQSVTSHERVMS